MRIRSSKSMLVFALALALGTAGCASSGSGGGSARPAGASSNRIVRAELEPLGQISALRAIERLRPSWLRSRSGDTPVLYVDGSRRGSANDLSSMMATEVEQLEYMSASDATNRYGTGHAGGAILVQTLR
jgi:hypothetical protein